MDEKYIYGIRLRVKDAGEAVKWLCGNLFFQIEKDGEVPVVKNGNARLILENSKNAEMDSYGPDDMCLGLRHIALETSDIRAAIAYCQGKGMELQLGENGTARHSGKVYGTGMDYFNIISGYGFTIEVSQKLHCSPKPGETLIAGLEHVGLQTADAYQAIRFYENLGFHKEFEPVTNFVDGHKIICGMVSAAGTTVEIYEFDDLENLPEQKHPVLCAMVIGDGSQGDKTVEKLIGTAGEYLEIYGGQPDVRAAG